MSQIINLPCQYILNCLELEDNLCNRHKSWIISFVQRFCSTLPIALHWSSFTWSKFNSIIIWINYLIIANLHKLEGTDARFLQRMQDLLQYCYCSLRQLARSPCILCWHLPMSLTTNVQVRPQELKQLGHTNAACTFRLCSCYKC